MLRRHKTEGGPREPPRTTPALRWSGRRALSKLGGPRPCEGTNRPEASHLWAKGARDGRCSVARVAENVLDGGPRPSWKRARKDR